MTVELTDKATELIGAITNNSNLEWESGYVHVTLTEEEFDNLQEILEYLLTKVEK